MSSLTDIVALHIKGERLWPSLMDLARIGATARGACAVWR